MSDVSSAVKSIRENGGEEPDIIVFGRQPELYGIPCTKFSGLGWSVEVVIDHACPPDSAYVMTRENFEYNRDLNVIE